jgi:hypothetical protein
LQQDLLERTALLDSLEWLLPLYLVVTCVWPGYVCAEHVIAGYVFWHLVLPQSWGEVQGS